MLLTENQNGINAAQQCSVANQKGAIAIDFDIDSALLVLNRTLLNSINTLMML